MPSSRAARRARRKAATTPRASQPEFRPRLDGDLTAGAGGVPDGDLTAGAGGVPDGDLAAGDGASNGDLAAALPAAWPARAASGDRPDPGSAAPVILLTYAYAGGGQVQELLDRDPSLACTAGTGILATCHQAAMTWRLIEGLDEDEPLSRLALASVRALATGMLTTITARVGVPRWCETVTVEPDSAQTFLELFPGTRFICVHRACPDVIFAITRASPWGLADRGFAAYTVTHPASTVAALAAWWADYAGALLGFEQAHPQACLRVRYEDIFAEPDATNSAIRTFLQLDRGSATPGLATPTEPPAPPRDDLGPPGCGAQMPAAQLQPQLAARINAIQQLLGYPPLPAAAPGGPAAPPAAANRSQTAADPPQSPGGSG
jgi:hypothetical protein